MSDIYYELGRLYSQLGKIEKAIESINHGLNWNPASNELYLLKFAIYNNNKEYDKAIETLNIAHRYIYSRSIMCKFYVYHGGIFYNRHNYKVANALASYAITYSANDSAINMLKEIAKQEDRNMDFTPKEEIISIFSQNNIPIGFDEDLIDCFMKKYTRLLQQNPNGNEMKEVCNILYDVTLESKYKEEATKILSNKIDSQQFFTKSFELLRNVDSDIKIAIKRLANENAIQVTEKPEEIVLNFNDTSKITYYFVKDNFDRAVINQTDGKNYAFDLESISKFKNDVKNEETNTTDKNMQSNSNVQKDLFDKTLINQKLNYGVTEGTKEVTNIANESEVVNENQDNISSTNGINLYTLEIEDYPTFQFYIPAELGEYVKTSTNVFEIKKDNIQKLRIMISRLKSVEDFEQDAKRWIEKNKEQTKMEDVSYRKETINGIPIEVYELRYIEHPNWSHKIYKIGRVNDFKITISGWLLNDREEIINNVFRKLNKLEKDNEKFLIIYDTSGPNFKEFIEIKESKLQYYMANGEKIGINDKNFIENMLICNVYLPISEKLKETFNNVKKYSSEEINKNYILSSHDTHLSIKYDDDEMDFDLNIGLYDLRLIESFIANLKNTITWYLKNKNG